MPSIKIFTDPLSNASVPFTVVILTRSRVPERVFDDEKYQITKGEVDERIPEAIQTLEPIVESVMCPLKTSLADPLFIPTPLVNEDKNVVDPF